MNYLNNPSGTLDPQQTVYRSQTPGSVTIPAVTFGTNLNLTYTLPVNMGSTIVTVNNVVGMVNGRSLILRMTNNNIVDLFNDDQLCNAELIRVVPGGLPAAVVQRDEGVVTVTYTSIGGVTNGSSFKFLFVVQ